MNYFGLFFTFMLPGVILGIMAAATLREVNRAKRRKVHRLAKRRAIEQARRRKQSLYISTLSPAGKQEAA